MLLFHRAATSLMGWKLGSSGQRGVWGALGWAKLGSRSEPVANACPGHLWGSLCPSAKPKRGSDLCFGIPRKMPRLLQQCLRAARKECIGTRGISVTQELLLQEHGMGHAASPLLGHPPCFLRRFSTKYWMSQTCTVCGKGMLFGLKCKNCKYGAGALCVAPYCCEGDN